MPFKSHLTVLVLVLCELHLIGSVINDKIALTIQTNNSGNKTTQLAIEDKTAPDSQPNSTTHLTSNDKDKAISTTHSTSNDKDKVVSTTHSTSNDKDKAVSTTHSTSNDKDKVVSTTHSTSNDKDKTVSTTHSTSNDKDKVVSTTRPANKDKVLLTTEPPKQSTLKTDTTHHSGGLAATIPSMFTIASLICVLLL